LCANHQIIAQKVKNKIHIYSPWPMLPLAKLYNVSTQRLIMVIALIRVNKLKK